MIFMSLKSRFTFLPLFTLSLILLSGGFNTVHAAKNTEEKTLSIACGAVGLEYEFCKQATAEWSKKSGVGVKLVSTPNETNQRLALFQQLLAAQSKDIDIFMVDVIWPGVLHTHFIDLKDKVPANEVASHFDNLIKNNTVKNRLVALPWFVDTGVMYYRKDLLEKHGVKRPSTWQELTSAAKKIQDKEKENNSKFVGYVFQGKAYEGLTCNFLEWTASHGGTAMVDASGAVNVNTPENVKALELAATWVKEISPKGVLNYAEEEARGVFQSGGAAFMRNWPYAWSLLNSEKSPVKDKVGVMPIPKGGDAGSHSPVLGGWQLAVSKYTEYPEEAVSLVRHLTSAAVQKDRLLRGNYFPTRKTLYQDEELKNSSPLFAVLAKSLETAVARPSRSTGPHYNRVSNEIWNSVFSALSDKESAEKSLQKLDRKLQRISRGGKWK